MKRLSFLALLAVLLFCLFSCNGSKKSENSIEISGAGATFPLPYYNLAFKDYMKSHKDNISYGGIGSGGGLRSLKDDVVDFAGSDAFLTDKEMGEMPRELIHIPTCIGGVVMAYKLNGIDSLKLSSELIASIYMGETVRWSDPAIAALNPGVKLPDIEICPVYRSDGSGTTYVFTYYLSQCNENWSKEMSYGKALNFSTGIAAKGNPGVAGIVSQTEGAIGYIGSEYAFAMNLNVASIKNSSGNFIYPSVESLSEAAMDDIPEDTRIMITNSGVETAYPISCLTWIVIYKEQSYGKRTEEQAKALKILMEWMVSEQSQKLCPKVNYASLPILLREKAIKAIESLTYKGNPIAQ